MREKTKKILYLLLFFISLYLFLASINLLGDGLKLLGNNFIKNLIALTANPFLGLIIGIFATAIIQSSSATTSITVSLVASNIISISNAIPIIMGANIGTTVTNTLVSLIHVTRKSEFQRAFPAAIVHDFFNILTILIVFPLELKYQILQRVSHLLSTIFCSFGGAHIANPLKYIITPLSNQILKITSQLNWLVVIFALLLLFFSLKFLVDSMKALSSRRLELIIDHYLFGSSFAAFLIGLITTALIQSSSVTTSLIIPLIGAGILSLDKGFPYMVGANIGTTITALLAALATASPLAIQIAFAHFGFNFIGSCIFLPLKIIPIKLALFFGNHASKNRFLAISYIVILFYLLPIIIFITTKLK
ncbi:MAG: Na/Pi symporter [candidate division WOR-3 bacterium]